MCMITLSSQLMYVDILDCTERTGTTEDDYTFVNARVWENSGTYLYKYIYIYIKRSWKRLSVKSLCARNQIATKPSQRFGTPIYTHLAHIWYVGIHQWSCTSHGINEYGQNSYATIWANNRKIIYIYNHQSSSVHCRYHITREEQADTIPSLTFQFYSFLITSHLS